MRYSKIKITNTVTKKLGLKPINLTSKSLGSTVAFTGKNGAGKSRVLSCLINYHSSLTEKEINNNYITCYPKTLNDKTIKYKKNQKSIHYMELSVNSDNVSSENKILIEKKIHDLKKAQIKLKKEKIALTKTLLKNHITVIDNDKLKNIKQHLDEGIDFNKLIYASKIEDLSILNSSETLEHIKNISTELVYDEFNNRFESNKNIEQYDSFKKFNSLAKYVNLFLNKKLSYKTYMASVKEPIKVDVLLQGKKINLDILSPGEKTLFAYAILLYYHDLNPNSSLKENIIFIDEPEKHLHPEAQIILLNVLRNLINDRGQLIIATHSITILSQLNYDEIFLCKDGEIHSPSRLIPSKTIGELFNLEQHVSTVKDFMFSISNWSYAYFVFECFNQPKITQSTNKNDPQFRLLQQTIKRRKTFKILDFGAGEGRIPKVFDEFSDKINIVPSFDLFDISFKNPEIIKLSSNINALYTDAKLIPSKEYDMVIMCNVLHEISPKEWVKIFKTIRSSLKDNGWLFIMEDKLIPHGENAHEFGYILLFEEQLKILFDTEKLGFPKIKKSSYKERILACIVPSKELNNVSDVNVLNAIKSLRSYLLEELRRIPKKQDLASGRIQGHYTKLFFNSQLFIEDKEYTTTNNAYISERD